VGCSDHALRILIVVDWISLIFMKQDLGCYRVHMCFIWRSDPVLMQSALYSRYRETPYEPITARTNVYTCLCMQESNISHLPDQVQGQVARLATPSQSVCWISGRWPRDRGPPAVPEASRLLVLPIAARRWVLTDNRLLIKMDVFARGYSINQYCRRSVWTKDYIWIGSTPIHGLQR
jgi:hypothetical protein